MCARYGYVLTVPDMDETDKANALMAFAEDCEGYGQPRLATPVSINPRVANPDSDIIAAGSTGQKAGSCHTCDNCIKADGVRQEFGWAVSMCKAKGSLIMQPSEEAKNCPYAKPGTPWTSVTNVELRKEFRPGFRVGSEKLIKKLMSGSAIDPREVETEIPVEPEDAADGIRAWFKVNCPFGTGKEIPLPIMDPSIFSPEELEMIPQIGDDHHPELYLDYGNLLWRFAVESWQLDRTLFIMSDPGLGKTEFAYYLGWRLQMPVVRIFCTKGMEWEEPFGKTAFDAINGTYWVDGRYTAAYRRPCIIIVDEPNMARPDVVATFRTTTENASTLFLDSGYARDDGERLKLTVKKHNYCFQVWAGNPAWDYRNIGVEELAAADISRLSPFLLLPPPQQLESVIIKRTVMELDGWEIPDDQLDTVLRISDDLRERSKQHTYPGTWGIRENIKVARGLAWYPLEEAYKMAAFNYFDPNVTADLMQQVIGLKVKD